MKLNFPAAEGPENFVLDMRKLLPKKWGEPRTAIGVWKGGCQGFGKSVTAADSKGWCLCCYWDFCPSENRLSSPLMNMRSLIQIHLFIQWKCIQHVFHHRHCALRYPSAESTMKRRETLPLPSKRLKLKEDEMTKVNCDINCHKSYNKVSRC